MPHLPKLASINTLYHSESIKLLNLRIFHRDIFNPTKTRPWRAFLIDLVSGNLSLQESLPGEHIDWQNR